MCVMLSMRQDCKSIQMQISMFIAKLTLSQYLIIAGSVFACVVLTGSRVCDSHIARVTLGFCSIVIVGIAVFFFVRRTRKQARIEEYDGTLRCACTNAMRCSELAGSAPIDMMPTDMLSTASRSTAYVGVCANCRT
jgi:hypothetical protein